MKHLNSDEIPAGIAPEDWTNWTWQMQNRVRGAAELSRYIDPTDDELQAIEKLAQTFRFVITPYYAS